jgi:hypothetical protein
VEVGNGVGVPVDFGVQVVVGDGVGEGVNVDVCVGIGGIKSSLNRESIGTLSTTAKQMEAITMQSIIMATWRSPRPGWEVHGSNSSIHCLNSSIRSCIRRFSRIRLSGISVQRTYWDSRSSMSNRFLCSAANWRRREASFTLQSKSIILG